MNLLKDRELYLQYMTRVAHRELLSALSLKDMDACMSILQEEIKNKEAEIVGKNNDDILEDLKKLKKNLKKMHKRKIDSIKGGYYLRRSMIIKV